MRVNFIRSSFSILAIYYVFLSYLHFARVLLRYCVISVHTNAFYSTTYTLRTQKLLALELGMYLVFVSFLCSHVP